MVLFEKAPAKINLSLDILGKRDDGYHEVEMVMTTIDLFDRIELRTLEKRYVPNDERNLAYQAAYLFKKQYNITQGVYIRIEKSIPVSAGLGGGSSDAAAVLRGLNRLWSLNIPVEELAELGLNIGSDVPFCVYNMTALVKGRGEQVYPLPSPPSCWVVLAKPDIGVSTRTIFQRVNLDHINHPQTQEIIDALHRSDFNHLCQHLGNALEDTTLTLHPEIGHIKERMQKVSDCKVLMSGSGPTVYSLFKQERQAQRMYNSLKGFCNEVYMVRLIG